MPTVRIVTARMGWAPKMAPLLCIVYEPNHHGDVAFMMAARNGVQAHHWRYGNMPAIEGVSEQEIVNIIAYVRALQKANGIF